MGTYIEMILAVSRLNESMETINREGSKITCLSNAAGAWVDMKGDAAEVVQQGVSFITKPFSSYLSNIGEVQSGFKDELVSEFTDSVAGQIKDKIQSVVAEYLKEGLSEIMGEAAASQAAETAG